MKQKITSASLWFTGLSLAASAVNFLYYPVIARFLNLAQFGDVQIGVSFVMQAAALFSSLNLVALFISAGSNAKDTTARLERILITPSIIAALIITLFANPISQVLQLHDPSLLYLLAVIFILNIPASTWIGTLQGEGHFLWSGGISLIASIIKIGASVLLITGGLGAHGAILGILLGTFVIIPFAYLLQKSNSLSLRETFRLATKQDFAFLLNNRFIILILFTFFGLALLSTFDTLFAKIHLPPSDAGSFAQLSIIAKITYFALLPISIILFNRFITSGQQHNKTLVLYSLAVIFSSAVIFIATPLLSQLLFDFSLSSSMKYVSFCLITAFGAFTISNLFMYFIVSKGAFKFAAVAMAFIFIVVTLPLSFATTATNLATTYAATQIIGTFLLLIVVGYTNKHAR